MEEEKTPIADAICESEIFSKNFCVAALFDQKGQSESRTRMLDSDLNELKAKLPKIHSFEHAMFCAEGVLDQVRWLCINYLVNRSTRGAEESQFASYASLVSYCLLYGMPITRVCLLLYDAVNKFDAKRKGKERVAYLDRVCVDTWNAMNKLYKTLNECSDNMDKLKKCLQDRFSEVDSVCDEIISVNLWPDTYTDLKTAPMNVPLSAMLESAKVGRNDAAMWARQNTIYAWAGIDHFLQRDAVDLVPEEWMFRTPEMFADHWLRVQRRTRRRLERVEYASATNEDAMKHAILESMDVMARAAQKLSRSEYGIALKAVAHPYFAAFVLQTHYEISEVAGKAAENFLRGTENVFRKQRATASSAAECDPHLIISYPPVPNANIEACKTASAVEFLARLFTNHDDFDFYIETEEEASAPGSDQPSYLKELRDSLDRKNREIDELRASKTAAEDEREKALKELGRAREGELRWENDARLCERAKSVPELDIDSLTELRRVGGLVLERLREAGETGKVIVPIRALMRQVNELARAMQ